MGQFEDAMREGQAAMDAADARKAQETAEKLGQGEYEHTFLEMWETQLTGHIEATMAPLSLPVAANILNAYPWLTHATINDYRSLRASLLQEAFETFLDTIGDEDDKKKRYKENVKDWPRHKELYMELIAAWNKMVSKWGDDWSEVAAATGPEGVSHAAIGDVSGLLLNNEYGLTEGLKTLKGFEFTQEDREKLDEMSGLSDE